jgi:Ring finger domain
MDIVGAVGNATGERAASAQAAMPDDGGLLDLLVFCTLCMALFSLGEVIRGLVSASPQRRWMARPRLRSDVNMYGAVEGSEPYETLIALEDVRVGLSEQQIRIMPTTMFESPWKGAVRDEEYCAVCREEFRDGDELLVMPCECKFHNTCIRPWLAQSASCPLCRARFA